LADPTVEHAGELHDRLATEGDARVFELGPDTPQVAEELFTFEERNRSCWRGGVCLGVGGRE